MLFWCLLPTGQARWTNQPGSWCWLVSVIGPHGAGEISHGGGSDAVCGPVRPGLPVTQAGLVTTPAECWCCQQQSRAESPAWRHSKKTTPSLRRWLTTSDPLLLLKRATSCFDTKRCVFQMEFHPQELSQHHQYRTPGNTTSNPGTQLMAQKEQEGHAARDHWCSRCHGCRELPGTRSESTATAQVPAQR